MGMGMELDAVSKKATALEHENGNLKDMESYNQATGGSGWGNGEGSASADKKKIEDLERLVETLQEVSVLGRCWPESGILRALIKLINFQEWVNYNCKIPWNLYVVIR